MRYLRGARPWCRSRRDVGGVARVSVRASEAVAARVSAKRRPAPFRAGCGVAWPAASARHYTWQRQLTTPLAFVGGGRRPRNAATSQTSRVVEATRDCVASFIVVGLVEDERVVHEPPAGLVGGRAERVSQGAVAPGDGSRCQTARRIILMWTRCSSSLASIRCECDKARSRGVRSGLLVSVDRREAAPSE